MNADMICIRSSLTLLVGKSYWVPYSERALAAKAGFRQTVTPTVIHLLWYYGHIA